jgi:hypothetical protein
VNDHKAGLLNAGRSEAVSKGVVAMTSIHNAPLACADLACRELDGELAVESRAFETFAAAKAWAAADGRQRRAMATRPEQ